MTRIAAVRILEARTVELTLTDGRIKQVDLEPLLHGPIFDAIRESDDLFASMSVDPETGTITWPNGADICPDVLVHDLPPA